MAHLTETGRAQQQHTDRAGFVTASTVPGTASSQTAMKRSDLVGGHYLAPAREGIFVRSADLRLGAFPNWDQWGLMAGSVVGTAGAPLIREVRAIHRSSRKLVNYTVSLADGSFTMLTPFVSDEHIILGIPDSSDIVNAKIYDRIVPV